MVKKTALISGIYGQDAFYLREKLLRQEYNIIGTTRKIKKESGIQKNIDVIQTDYSKIHLEKILLENEIDVIFHLCGQSKVALSWEHLEETIDSQVSPVNTDADNAEKRNTVTVSNNIGKEITVPSACKDSSTTKVTATVNNFVSDFKRLSSMGEGQIGKIDQLIKDTSKKEILIFLLV